MTTTIEAHELTKRFRGFVAVDAVTFTVAPGEIFGFLGPNGAGKTTTIKMLNGLLTPSAGTALVAGGDVVRDRERIRHRIGYMSQLFSLYPDLTVEENIRLFAGLYGIGGNRWVERRDWVLAMSDLAHHRHLLTGSLPLGWKQRLALGCAVLHRPPILFLDEPTSGVDPVARRTFWDLIDGLAREGTTVLVSTHYMEEAEYCHRLALMNRGRLIAVAAPHVLRGRMREPIIELTADDPPRAAAVLARHSEVLEAALYGRAVRAVVRDRDLAIASLPQALDTAGIRCSHVETVEPSLEDVFVAEIRKAGGAVNE